MVRAHCFIQGKVQGVGFRAYTHTQALAFHLVGWVRNCDDGSVEVEVEGEKDAIENFLKALKAGPAFSRVDHLDLQWGEASLQYRSFQVVY